MPLKACSIVVTSDKGKQFSQGIVLEITFCHRNQGKVREFSKGVENIRNFHIALLLSVLIGKVKEYQANTTDHLECCSWYSASFGHCFCTMFSPCLEEICVRASICMCTIVCMSDCS